MLAECEHGGHPATLSDDSRMAHGVHPGMHSVQSAYIYPMLDRAALHSKRHELSPSNHTMLQRSDLGDQSVDWSTSCTYVTSNVDQSIHTPMIARETARYTTRV